MIEIIELKSNMIDDVKEFLFKQIKKEFGYGYIPEYHKDIVNLEKYYIKPQRNNFYIALDSNKNKIIGTIGLRSYDKNFEEFKGTYSNLNTSSIWRLFIDNEYRRCGIATLLFEISEKFIIQNNFTKIYLHTHKTLPGALNFWKKMGFNITWDTNNELETVHMDKKINNISQLSTKQAIPSK